MTRCAAEDSSTEASGSARATSSAVRSAPTRRARSLVPEQCGHLQLLGARPHHPQRIDPSAPRPSGPWHDGHRATVRHLSHDTTGTYPAEATCMSTAPPWEARRTRRSAWEGNRTTRPSPVLSASRLL